MINYKTLIDALNTLNNLRSLHIEVNSFGFINLRNVEYCNKTLELLIEDNKKDDFLNIDPSPRQIVLLGLAITQEIRQKDIDQREIDFVNEALDMSISKEEVNVYYSKYI